MKYLLLVYFFSQLLFKNEAIELKTEALEKLVEKSSFLTPVHSSKSSWEDFQIVNDATKRLPVRLMGPGASTAPTFQPTMEPTEAPSEEPSEEP
eukprot:gene15344-17162_t